jgi:hypothetical protein
LSSQKHRVRLDHSTGTWFMLASKTEQYEPQFADLDYYFTDKETKEEEIDNEFAFNSFLEQVVPNDRKWIIVNLIAMIKGLVKIFSS